MDIKSSAKAWKLRKDQKKDTRKDINEAQRAATNQGVRAVVCTPLVSSMTCTVQTVGFQHL